MKKSLFVLSFTFGFGILFAQNIDSRQVIFGNNYEQIKEINAEDFFKQYPQVKDKKNYPLSLWVQKNKYVLNWDDKRTLVFIEEEKNYKRVYEQRIGESIFYRVLYSNERLTDEKILDWKKRYIEQYLFYKEGQSSLTFLDAYAFGGVLAHQWGNQPLYCGVEIIQRNNKIIGLLNYRLEYIYKATSLEIRSEGTYYLWKDIIIAERNEKRKIPSIALYDLPVISIEASKPLVDSKRPFMYTIQNAFDGNPATSYVEDTEDDLMHIAVMSGGKMGQCQKIALINGYAQNESFYKNNNRIKSFREEYISQYGTKDSESEVEHIAQDNFLGIQIFPYESYAYFSVIDVYKGVKYTETCLAELDFLTQNYGWLFGGFDE